MGDLFFILKMTVYTLIIVVVMQVKIGTTTIEQKVIAFTHQSQLAGALQGVAQGAATFVGDQFKAIKSQINSKYIDQHSDDQIPGQRLKSKMEDIKKSLKADWDLKKNQVEEFVEEKIKDTKSDDQP